MNGTRVFIKGGYATMRSWVGFTFLALLFSLVTVHTQNGFSAASDGISEKLDS